MDYAEKYNFEMFTSHNIDYGNAAPALPEIEEPRPRLVPKPMKPRPTPKQKTKTVEFSLKGLLKELWQITKRLTLIIAITSVVGLCVQRDAYLTELTDQIQTVKKELQDAQSTETQLQMEIESKFNNIDMDKYATQTLGMQKIQKSQVSYINTHPQDKGTVYDVKSDWEKLFETIKAAINGIFN